MDTVREETSSALSSPTASTSDKDQFLFPTGANHDDFNDDTPKPSRSTSISSRRPSLILAALRRPSQALALSAAHAIMNQKKQLMNFISPERNNGPVITDNEKKEVIEPFHKDINHDTLTTILSALYAKLLVVLGIAFPMTEIISKDVQPSFYQGFYLFLYIGSIGFIAYMYASLVRNKTIYSMFGSTDENHACSPPNERNKSHQYFTGTPHQEKHFVRYGSFYLRLGAIAFGIGSMVYSGLEFGTYFEMKNDKDCQTSILQAITPATRMILTIIQIQFIFLNSKDMDTSTHTIISKFGLMHMIATNLCEWLYVLVEETEHEILHLAEHEYRNITKQTYCRKANVMTSLVTNASPFLFPCTIEYSLICAVILLEMWKEVKTVHTEQNEEKKDVRETRMVFVSQQEKVTKVFNFQPHKGQDSAYHFTLDCSHSHKGLFAGILLIVLTIISLTLFFVLRAYKGTPEEELLYKTKAQLQVNVFELMIHIMSTLAVLLAMYKFRHLKYEKNAHRKSSGLGLDCTLLVVAQTGMFIYCVFAIIGNYFMTSHRSPHGLLAEIFSFIQTCLQTIFVLDGWTKRCRNHEQVKHKPGRELITFLIVANMAQWSINCLEKNRAEFRTNQLNFYGPWAWTIITHISMPLAIFYRFHSTICLFEIWKSAYKIKSRKEDLYDYM